LFVVRRLTHPAAGTTSRMIAKRLKKRIRLASVPIVAIALASASIASAASATLHLSAIVQKPKSLGGGAYTTKEELFEGTRRIGEDVSRCSETSRNSNEFRCTGSYTLTRGTIDFAGTVRSGSNRLAMTGGTGAYRGARGTVQTEYNKTSTRAKETLTFR
jgi:hypothetical protein